MTGRRSNQAERRDRVLRATILLADAARDYIDKEVRREGFEPSTDAAHQTAALTRLSYQRKDGPRWIRTTDRRTLSACRSNQAELPVRAKGAVEDEIGGVDDPFLLSVQRRVYAQMRRVRTAEDRNHVDLFRLWTVDHEQIGLAVVSL